MKLWLLFLLFLICITAFVEAWSGDWTKIQVKDENAISDDEESVEEKPAKKSLRTASITAKGKKSKPKESPEDDEVDEPKSLKKNPKRKPKKDESEEEADEKPWPICEPTEKKKPEKKGDDKEKKDKTDEKKTDKNKKDDEKKKDETPEKEDDTADEDYDEEEQACHCEINDVTCDNVFFGGDTKLSTLMLKIQDKNIVPLIFTSRDNDFEVLSKDKIIPSMAETITELDLSRNKIWEIEKEAFYNFKNMTKLRLTGNNLRKLDPEIFKGAPESQLHKLYLGENLFTSIPNKTFSLLKNLKELVLDYTRIPITKGLFEELENLEELSLDYCQLGDKNFDVNVFDNLPNLKVLSLRGNHFTQVPKAIQSLKKLEILDLSETHITEFHEKSFKDDQSLKVLHAKNMPYLGNLDDCAFCDLNQLEELYFANSPQLWNINKNAFGYVRGNKAKNVKKIDFTNSNVTILHEETLPWGKDIELLLTGNPVNCSCDTAWLLEEEVYSFDQEDLIPKCKTPSKVEGKPLAIVQQSEVCENIRKKKQIGRILQAFVLPLLASLLCLTFYYLVTSCKLINCPRPKTGVNGIYSNLSPTDEQLFERDFKPKAQEV